jgi:hypothetical protein
MEINREIASKFGGKIVNSRVNYYISKDKLNNYLHLFLSNEDKKIEYVLVIRNSEFYQFTIP